MMKPKYLPTWISAVTAGLLVAAGCGQPQRDGPFSPRYLDQPGEPVLREGPPIIDKPSSPRYNMLRTDLLRPDDEPMFTIPVLDRLMQAVEEQNNNKTEFEPHEVQVPQEMIESLNGAARNGVNHVMLPRIPESPGTSRSSGNYLMVGLVVAEVNGRPIYADRVLAAVEPALAAEARQLDHAEFEQVAWQLIQNQVTEFVRDELLFAAAQRHLGSNDRRLAHAMTMEWRKEQIKQAGGSVERARRRAAEAGEDFEELVHQMYRVNLIRVFMHRRVLPHVDVSANDMRRYYRLNQDLFTEQHARVRFRTIEIDPARAGGRAEALDLAESLHRRLLEGADFEALAREHHHNAALARAGGDEGWVDKGAFAFREVEEAVWALQPGETTGIIEADGRFYLARVEEREPGRVRPFADPSVQQYIYRTLENAQRMRRNDQYIRELAEASVERYNPEWTHAIMDMVMQSYPAWSGAQARAEHGTD